MTLDVPIPIKLGQSFYFYRPKRSFGQGNIFTGVCLSTGGGVPAPNFRGGYFFGGGVFFRGGIFFGGVFFRGGGIFSGGVFFRGGLSTGIRSTFGRYASYWNAFLFLLCKNNLFEEIRRVLFVSPNVIKCLLEIVNEAKYLFNSLCY